MWLEALYGVRDWQRADEILEEAVKANALSSYAYEMVGVAYEFQRRSAEALENFRKARQPRLPEGLWAGATGDDWKLGTRIADCEWDLGHYKRSLAELAHVLPEVPEDRRG